MHIKFAECCPARWTICLLTCKRQNTKRELGIVIANIFWIFRALYMLSEPSWYTLCLPFVLQQHDLETIPILYQIRSWARSRMTVKAPRSKPQMLSKRLSSVSAMACPMEVSPHITNLELAPDFC